MHDTLLLGKSLGWYQPRRNPSLLINLAGRRLEIALKRRAGVLPRTSTPGSQHRKQKPALPPSAQHLRTTDHQVQMSFVGSRVGLWSRSVERSLSKGHHWNLGIRRWRSHLGEIHFEHKNAMGGLHSKLSLLLEFRASDVDMREAGSQAARKSSRDWHRVRAQSSGCYRTPRMPRERRARPVRCARGPCFRLRRRNARHSMEALLCWLRYNSSRLAPFNSSVAWTWSK